MITFINEELNKTYETFGEMIHEARMNAHMTIEELADKSGIRPRMIQKYENNQVSVTIDDFAKITVAMNILGNMGFKM